jgi:hypothetical protein
MAWPPPALPINRTNATTQQDTHPGDHNQVNQAMNDTVAHVQGIDNTLTGVINETHRLAAHNQAVALSSVHISGGGAYQDVLIGSSTVAAVSGPTLLLVTVRCAYSCASDGAGNLGVSVRVNGTTFGGGTAPHRAVEKASIAFTALWNLNPGVAGVVEVYLTVPPVGDVTTIADWTTNIVEIATFATP